MLNLEQKNFNNSKEILENTNVDFGNTLKKLDNTPSHGENTKGEQHLTDEYLSIIAEEVFEKLGNNVMIEDLSRRCLYELGVNVDPNLNIYITQYGAWMTNCSGLKLDSSEDKKEQYLKRSYFKEYIENGYKLNFGPSFTNPDELAVYVENWKDKSIHKYGTVPGCIRANMSKDRRRDM